MISIQVLIAIGISPTLAKLHAPFMEAACERFSINTPARCSAFIGQCAHETKLLTAFEENLYYTNPQRIVDIFSRVHTIEVAQRLARNPQALSNFVYADRYGNGNEASGDGWRYRGRGAGHLTFKANYEDAGKALGRPYVEQPELVAQPEDAALTFAWFFSSRGCNELADAWNIDGVTAKINPGMAAADQRRALCDAAVAAYRYHA